MGSALLSVGLLLALFLALLGVPVAIAFRISHGDGETGATTRGQVHFRWLFGLVRFRIAIPTKSGTEKKHGHQLHIKEREQKSSGRSVGAFAILRQSAFRHRAFRFLKDVFRATHARDLYLRLRIGLGDPADTGRLWALLGPVAGLATNVSTAVVRIEPEFMDPVFELESQGKFRLIPLQFIALALAFALSPPSLRAWRMMHRGGA